MEETIELAAYDNTAELAESLMSEPTNELRTKIEKVLGTQNDFSPYEAAGRASILAGRYVREQMLYNYVAKNYIASSRGERTLKNGTKKTIKVILRADLVNWLEKYLTPKTK